MLYDHTSLYLTTESEWHLSEWQPSMWQLSVWQLHVQVATVCVATVRVATVWVATVWVASVKVATVMDLSLVMWYIGTRKNVNMFAVFEGMSSWWGSHNREDASKWRGWKWHRARFSACLEHVSYNKPRLGSSTSTCTICQVHFKYMSSHCVKIFVRLIL